MKNTLSFEDAAAGSLDFSGGKGANLSLLTQRGFPVPRGFVIGVMVYKEFVRQAGDGWLDAKGLSLGNPAELRKECGEIQKKLLKHLIPEHAAIEISKRLRDWPEDTFFSVRSSSTMEDLAGAAFAGQHETFLHVRADEVVARVRACYSSLWADRAVAYREQQGFDHAHAAMAVVVQEMVPSECAGVGFSINPVNGNLAEMVVNSNFGLGESVVSGEGEVDQWIIDKADRSIRLRNIGRKSRKVIGGDAGTCEMSLTDDESSAASMDEGELAELVDLLIRVEDSYGFPQDIEWAFAKGKLWLLQSRPVTTIPPHWTRDESAERFPNVITPLTWDFVESGFHRSLDHSFELLDFPAFSGKWFAKFDHYIYGDQNAVELHARRAPFYVSSLDDLRAMIPELRRRYAWVQELPVAWMRDLDHYLVTLGRFQGEPLEEKSPLEIWRHVLAVNEHGARYFLPNIAISIAHGTIYQILHGLLQLVCGHEGGNEIFDRLMAWCDTKTGQINKELFDLALMVKEQPMLRLEIASRASREILLNDGLGGFPEFSDRFQRFIRDHGHREVDFDAYIATWGEAPEIVLDNVRLILDSPMDHPPSETQRELKVRAQEAEAEFFNQLPPDLHFFFHELLRLARVYTSLDDLEHYQTTRLTPALRRGLRALGEKLAPRDLLDEPMDVFFAHQQQMETALLMDSDEGWAAFADQVKTQKTAYHRDRMRKPDWVLGESGPVFRKDDGDFLQGLAGSAGVAEGPVFLVLGPDDFAKFPKGAVLVAGTTNPTWTPLFYNAAAVITESGGPLSHGAVTAREMRIPAVMSVRESLSRLSNGTRVRVDGGTGRVEIL
ncbi:MAG: PEP/pyruvate-binding domain-containing protein [Verrucomicrobiota bacterium]